MATGLSISSTSNLTSGQKIVIAAARTAFEPAAPDPDLVGSERIGAGEKQWDVSTYARLDQADALTEGADLSSVQQLRSNVLTITPSEHGIIATLSKRLIRRQADSNAVATAGTQQGQSLRRRMANDVIALYDGFSKSVVSAGSSLDITHFRGSVAYLLTDNDSDYGPAPMPLRAALHIEQISDIIDQITDQSPRGTTAGITDRVLQQWWKGSDRLYGVSIFHSGNITIDSGNDAKGAIMAEDALHLVMATNADATEETDNSLRAVEYGLFQEWGEGERADPHGVEVFSDAEATV